MTRKDLKHLKFVFKYNTYGNVLSALSRPWSVVKAYREALNTQIIERKKREEAEKEEQNALGELNISKCYLTSLVLSRSIVLWEGNLSLQKQHMR